MFLLVYDWWHIADAKVNKIRRVWGNIYVILGIPTFPGKQS